jgi:acetyl esterase
VSGRLDPQAQAVLEVMQAAGEPPLHTMTVAQARDRMRAAFVTRGQPIELASVEDRVIPYPGGGLALRLYRPRTGPLPLGLFLRGGGWALNDLDTHDDLCRRLAKRSGWAIASLDYRRAPEHKYPAALLDAYVAFRWLQDNARRLGCVDSTPAVIGESAGANIAAGLSLLLRDCEASVPCYQVLIYPVTDRPGRWPSYEERGVGYALDRDQLHWFLAQYASADCVVADPYLFPLCAEDLSRLPPTLVVTAEFDPLRDEGAAFARQLAQAGVEVEHEHAADQMHGFLMLARVVSRADALVSMIAARLAARGNGSVSPDVI